MQAPSPEEAARLAAEEEAKADEKGKKGKKGKDKGKKEKGKKGKGKKGKKGKGDGDDAPKAILPPPLTGPSEFTQTVRLLFGTVVLCEADVVFAHVCVGVQCTGWATLVAVRADVA